MASDDESWPMRAYGMLERGISAIILLGMIGVVALATFAFLRAVFDVTLSDDPALDYQQFQTLFDSVLAAIIAVELAHSIRQMVAGEHGFGQLRTVIAIGMLAVVRKLIVLEADSASGSYLVGIAAAVAALAVALMAIRWIEMRREG